MFVCEEKNLLQPKIIIRINPIRTKYKTSVRTKPKKVVGQYFNGPGHSISNIVIGAIEKVYERGRLIFRREKVCGLKY